MSKIDHESCMNVTSWEDLARAFAKKTTRIIVIPQTTTFDLPFIELAYELFGEVAVQLTVGEEKTSLRNRLIELSIAKVNLVILKHPSSLDANTILSYLTQCRNISREHHLGLKFLGDKSLTC